MTQFRTGNINGHFVRKHAAEIIGVTERVLQGAIERGDIKAVRFGHRILVPGSEVKRIVEALEKPSVAIEAREMKNGPLDRIASALERIADFLENHHQDEGEKP